MTRFGFSPLRYLNSEADGLEVWCVIKTNITTDGKTSAAYRQFDPNYQLRHTVDNFYLLNTGICYLKPCTNKYTYDVRYDRKSYPSVRPSPVAILKGYATAYM